MNAARRTVLAAATTVVAAAALVACGGGGNGAGYDSTRSAARNWNEALLAAIRVDLARPTVHARNLFHSSAMMYDLWAVYDDTADPFFLGATVGGFHCPLTDAEREALRSSSVDRDADREAAIGHAMHRLLTHRFRRSPGGEESLARFDDLLRGQGQDPSFDSTDFSGGDARALGLHAADCVIAFGLADGANETANYANRFYRPVNGPLAPAVSGSSGLSDPNRWQPLRLEVFIDQSGNPGGSEQPFLGAEWGNVVPFALGDRDCRLRTRDGARYRVCLDPGPPARLTGPGAMPDEYRWTHALVALWSAHLDPSDGVVWDVSPASIGNTEDLPATIAGQRGFYDALEGGVRDRGHPVNPVTGEPYRPQLVPRGDYTRVLAEFWADGPESETPPGHWFTVVNHAVSDHPAFEKRYRGTGPPLGDLEWDVKTYFTLGGAMHDAAIAAWGVKGWYDSARPISAIRYMSSQGQSTDPTLPRFSSRGLPLVPGRIETVAVGDPLAGASGENVGKVKILAWRGPNAVADPSRDVAGVGWILADDWWPYQRPTFVTPPFAGYVSGHSTFSRAAAEVLTTLTGSEFFPGGLAEFVAREDDFLVFERGPSVDVVLQWATFRDASDQTSLSRIWGGIHPPIDDVPGRGIGIAVAARAAALADAHVTGRAR